MSFVNLHSARKTIQPQKREANVRLWSNCENIPSILGIWKSVFVISHSLKQIWGNDQTTSRNVAHFKNDQKWRKNKYLTFYKIKAKLMIHSMSCYWVRKYNFRCLYFNYRHNITIFLMFIGSFGWLAVEAAPYFGRLSDWYKRRFTVVIFSMPRYVVNSWSQTNLYGTKNVI